MKDNLVQINRIRSQLNRCWRAETAEGDHLGNLEIMAAERNKGRNKGSGIAY